MHFTALIDQQVERLDQINKMHEEMMENAKRQQARRWEHPWKLLAGSIEQCN